MIIILVVVGGVLLLTCGGGVLILLPAVQKAREETRRATAQNNVKQIGLALHNYHDAHRTLPAGGISGEDGTEYISWQTSLLPYVDQGPLFDMIDKEVSWTDPDNARYYATIVPAYVHPSIADRPFNNQGLAVSHYAGNSHVFTRNSSLRFADFKDGLSNTVVAGDVAAGFRPWADPGNVRDPAAGIAVGLNTFSGPAGQSGTQLLMGDGAVRVVAEDISPDVLEAIATPAGGESVPEF
jgi:hypothetical protein